ncbi:drebrin-like protein isoform X2 [Contarinia nasturtii]|uniref:drebrin-like protein isoform X2 n=1 Tax=Contarinia nasturtii TaxID=265458 RepID=UPI0012D38007|nr:drebrin-like protein isoform X2 [Contarinia nasturtii]
MAVDLDKNRNDIVNAWKDVVDAKTDTDWALFGYEGHSNVLKVVSTGNGGLIELTDELNSGKILYAFVNISNDKTNLTKYLLINWQGEGAPTLRKGTCANHIREISKVLTGAHLTLNARTEDDIDTDRILAKLNSIRFAVKENRPRIEDEPQKVIGTNYSRVIPSKEINSKDRDNFWKKEEEEERIRTEAEREKQRIAKIELEKEQRLRETQEHSEREKRRLEAAAESNANGVKLDEPKNIQMPKPSVERSTTQAEEMRQQRNQEARQLIGNSVDKAKAIFAQNTAAGQLQNKSVKIAPLKPARNSITRSTTSTNNNQQQQQSPEPEKNQQQQQSEQSESPTGTLNNNLQETTVADQPIHTLDDDDSDPYSTIKRSPYTKVNTNSCQSETSANNKQSDNVQTESVTNQQNTVGKEQEMQQAEHELEIAGDQLAFDGSLQDHGLRARALYDYQADDESEITFDPGDIISHIDKIDQGWWQGLSERDGSYGLFPANYVELLND